MALTMTPKAFPVRWPVQLSCLLLQPTRPLQQDVELEVGNEKHTITMEDLISPVSTDSMHMHRPHFLTAFSPGPSTRRASLIALLAANLNTRHDCNRLIENVKANSGGSVKCFSALVKYLAHLMPQTGGI